VPGRHFDVEREHVVEHGGEPLATSIDSHTWPHASHSSTGTPSTTAVRPSRSATWARATGRRSPLSQ
jgi:hypothetical protein